MSDRLIRLFAEGLQVPPDALTDDSGPDNTPSWDSLAAMDLVALIEETFDVELTTAEIMKMRTLGIAREVLREKGIQGI